MDKQFTASEVRKKEIWLNDAVVRKMLHAFADLLEAQEKAEAIGFLSAGALAALVDCRSDDYNGNVDIWMRANDAVKATIPVYTHPAPSNAERLAEALRNLVSEWVAIADDGDATLEDSAIGYRACANRLSAMLTAHSAQAQPLTASDDAEQLALCREDWQSVCDAIHPGWHFNPEEIIARLKQPPAASVPEVTGLTWEPPNVKVDVERVGRFRSGDEHIVRVTFRSSDDGRRMTCFYAANESAVGYLHAMLAAQENPNG